MQIKNLPHSHGKLPENLMAEMPGAGAFENASDIFKLLSDGKRVQLFWLLCHCEECVINISSLLDMSSPAVSHHLKLLKTAGLIVSRREGREVYYTAAPTSRAHILHLMIEDMVELTCPAEAPDTVETPGSPVCIVNEIHSLLVSDLSNRYTVEELAEKYHINQTTLKTTFKQVFGAPVGTYMKEYRVKKAMELLRTTELTVAEIADRVGYESQSKFSAAFRNVTGVLPSEYRAALHTNH